jgi:oligoribonuclease NrnB/cAMP/cGMP phosphodiesterase (DHH superfamily)
MHRAFPDAEFVPVSYGQDPPDVKGKTVYILDFSYKRPVMLRLVEAASQLVVLDHHKSAEADLRDLAPYFMSRPPYVVFDVEKSGARLTWEYLRDADLLWKTGFTNHQNHWLVRYTEDYDLWTCRFRSD